MHAADLRRAWAMQRRQRMAGGLAEVRFRTELVPTIAWPELPCRALFHLESLKSCVAQLTAELSWRLGRVGQ